MATTMIETAKQEIEHAIKMATDQYDLSPTDVLLIIGDLLHLCLDELRPKLPKESWGGKGGTD